MLSREATKTCADAVFAWFVRSAVPRGCSNRQTRTFLSRVSMVGRLLGFRKVQIQSPPALINREQISPTDVSEPAFSINAG